MTQALVAFMSGGFLVAMVCAALREMLTWGGRPIRGFGCAAAVALWLLKVAGLAVAAVSLIILALGARS